MGTLNATVRAAIGRAVTAVTDAGLGGAFVFTRAMATLDDPVTGTTSGDAPVAVAVDGIAGPVTDRRDERGVGGAVVSTRELLVTALACARGAAAAGVADYRPAPGDTVAVDGATWTVAGVTPIAPTGASAAATATAYVVEVTR